MPTYQYACTSCGEQIEAVQRFTDEPLSVCPACGGALRKVFSPVGIVFKGSGFYRTDSRNGSVSSGEKVAAKPNGPGGGTSSDGKSADAKSSKDTGSSSSSSPATKNEAGKKPAGAGSTA